MSNGSIARSEIEAARRYSLSLLEGVDEKDWFRMPAEGVTHIAWQVGHLAAAQNMLTIVRLRGERPDDAERFPPAYAALFARGSVPIPDAAKYPSPAQLRATLDRVMVAARQVIAEYSDADLAQTPIGPPHSLFNTKLGGLFWCARHEMLHGGQIGLLKRLLGTPAKW